MSAKEKCHEGIIKAAYVYALAKQGISLDGPHTVDISPSERTKHEEFHAKALLREASRLATCLLADTFLGEDS